MTIKTFPTIVNFSDSGRLRFRDWMSRNVQPNKIGDALVGQCLDVCADRLQRGDDLGFEVSRLDSISGNPEIWMARSEDFEIAILDENGEEAK